MATQNTIQQSLKSVVPGLALLLACANPLDEAAVQFSHLLCALTGELFQLLPGILTGTVQFLGAYALDHGQLFAYLGNLASGWSLLRLLLGA
jgi:hypothetical protein